MGPKKGSKRPKTSENSGSEVEDEATPTKRSRGSKGKSSATPQKITPKKAAKKKEVTLAKGKATPSKKGKSKQKGGTYLQEEHPAPGMEDDDDGGGYLPEEVAAKKKLDLEVLELQIQKLEGKQKKTNPDKAKLYELHKKRQDMELDYTQYRADHDLDERAEADNVSMNFLSQKLLQNMV